MTGISDDQVMAAFERWKNLDEEKARVADDLKELFSEQKAFGHDTKAMRAAFRLKVKLDEASPEDAEHEAKVDLYLAALNATRASRAYARENVEEFDAETGEVFDTRSPRKAADAVSERTATNQPETANEMDREEMRDGRAVHSLPAGNARKAMPETERGDVNHAGAGESPATEFAPASHGEAEAKSPETEEGDSNEVAHVHSHAATAGTRINHIVPATPGITFEDCPPKPMKRLPFAHCFPELTKSEYGDLSALIEEHGVEEPIIRNGDTIIDGWNRYSIARSLGIAYPVKQFEGGDILSFVIAAHRSARDWLPSQERKIAAALCKELPHRANDIKAAFHIEEEFA